MPEPRDHEPCDPPYLAEAIEPQPLEVIGAVDYSGQEVASSPVAATSRRNWLLLAVAVGLPIIGLVFMAGLAAVGWYIWNMSPASSREYAAWREPVSSQIPDRIREALREPTEKDLTQVFGDQADEVVQLLVNTGKAPAQIDVSRFLEEMVRCGIAKGLNSISAEALREHLEKEMEYDPFGQRVHVLNVEVLKPEEEVRLLVFGEGSGIDWLCLYEVYLIKRHGKWRLYDWHDRLLPLSEVQRAAAEISRDNPSPGAFVRLNSKMIEIGNAEEELDICVEKMIRARRETFLPHLLATQADAYLACYLCMLGAGPQLCRYLERLPDDWMAGKHFYLARAYQLSGEADQAFQHAVACRDEFGWHPAVALILAQTASDEQQRRIARDELVRYYRLCPHDYLVVYYLAQYLDVPTFRQLIDQLPFPSLLSLTT
ncbi:MAG: hypothetical protein KatS3mg111_2639 [Pirellulaceae bacterium]|nr:MAG: hypothetical protein KatS3mg111_2639 [Pirellulaceae bacterium]